MEPILKAHEQHGVSAGTPKREHVDSPAHPISQLQGPFDESIVEAIEGTENKWTVELDAQSRRRDLLENAKYERLCGRRWRQRPGERQAVSRFINLQH